MKRAITLSAIIGLSLAGSFRTDMRKVGHFISEHHQAIESGLETGVKIAGSLAEDDDFGFRSDLKKVGHFLSEHHEAIESGIETGAKIAGSLAEDDDFGFRSDMDKVGHFVVKHHEAIETGVEVGAKVAGVLLASSFVNVDGLVQDGVKAVQDVTQKNKNIGQLVTDGLHIVGDLANNNGNTEELFNIGGILHDGGDVAEIAEAGVKVAGALAEDSLVNVQGLITDGIKTYGDATVAKPNIGTLVNDGVSIVQDLTDNQFGYMPTEANIEANEAYEREVREEEQAFQNYERTHPEQYDDTDAQDGEDDTDDVPLE